ncbi:hypothetical protein Goshw_025389 [Gossypium schwendimanii]|uniref:Uncharacterized protein n=1 Tax=Gossypium schwendimanii TaxID=34291 RepID=A0A7J9N1F6_GOSSC|nr:hypothetical protein [Gossypium schwendimanii]
MAAFCSSRLHFTIVHNVISFSINHVPNCLRRCTTGAIGTNVPLLLIYMLIFGVVPVSLSSITVSPMIVMCVRIVTVFIVFKFRIPPRVKGMNTAFSFTISVKGNAMAAEKI